MTTRPSPALAGAESDTCPDGLVAGRYALDGHTIVWAVGEIDIATAPQLMEELAHAVRSHQSRVIVDLTQVTFMDSTGLSALVRARRKVEAGTGELRLVGACPMIRKILRVTGLEAVFPVHASLEEAIGQGPAVRHIGTVVQLPAHAEPRG